MISAVALFCQDIREEKAGTVSIIGVFTDNITVQKVPFAFPQMAIYTRINFPVSEEPPRIIAMRIVFADGREIDLATFDAELIQKARSESVAKGSAKAGLVATAAMAPVPIAQAGRINVIAKIDGQDSVCGTLNVQVPDAKA